MPAINARKVTRGLSLRRNGGDARCMPDWRRLRIPNLCKGFAVRNARSAGATAHEANRRDGSAAETKPQRHRTGELRALGNGRDVKRSILRKNFSAEHASEEKYFLSLFASRSKFMYCQCNARNASTIGFQCVMHSSQWMGECF